MQMNAFLQSSGYKMDMADLKQARRLGEIAKGVQEGNWGLAGALGGLFAKASQGGTGVLTDADMKVFYKNLGSLKQKSFDAFNSWMEGGPTPEKVAELSKAIRVLESAARKNIASAADSAEEVMEQYGSDGEAQMKAYFGRGFKATEKRLEDELIKESKGKPGGKK